jgi:phospholipase C
MSKYAVPLLALAGAANAVSLGDVKHVIMVMFENRSFNHVSVYGRRCQPFYQSIEARII